MRDWLQAARIGGGWTGQPADAKVARRQNPAQARRGQLDRGALRRWPSFVRFVVGDHVLDERKDFLLFELDVFGELCSELVQEGEGGLASEEVRVAADADVILEHPRDRGVVGVAVFGVGGKQDLLLGAEVESFFGFPVRQEGERGGGCGFFGCAAEHLGEYQCVVMVAGERCKRWVALHRSTPWDSCLVGRSSASAA
jgi:hypothetical protein